MKNPVSTDLLLFKTFVKILKNTSEQLWQQKRIFVVSWIVLVSIFMLLIWILFYSFFAYLVNYIPWGYVFAPKMLGVILTLVFGFIVLLSFIATYPTMFRNKEIPFLQVLPVPYKSIFNYNFVKILYYSLYGSVFLLIPTLIAYSLALGSSLPQWISIALSTIGLTIIAAQLGVVAFWLIAVGLLSLPSWIQKIVFGLVFVGLIMWLPKILPYFKITGEPIDIIQEYVFGYNYHNWLLPSNWFTEAIVAAQRWEWSLVAAWLLMSFAFAWVIWSLMEIIAQKRYLQGLQNIYNFHLFNPRKKIRFKSIWFGRSKYLALFGKDFLIHLRDPSQWTQFFVFAALLFVYVATIKSRTLTSLEDPVLVSILTLGNLGVISFFLGGIALRFVFPNISLEWRAFWILKLLPVPTKGIYFVKFLFFWLGIGLTAIVLSRFYLNILWVLPEVRWYIYFLTVVASFFVTAVFFALGSAFPNFEESNPSKIATSYGGLLATFFSNVVILAMLALLWQPFLSLYKARLWCQPLPNLWPVVLWLSSGLVLISLALLFYGNKAFEKVEV